MKKFFYTKCQTEVEFDTEQLHLRDHDYIANINPLSTFSEEAIIHKEKLVDH